MVLLAAPANDLQKIGLLNSLYHRDISYHIQKGIDCTENLKIKLNVYRSALKLTLLSGHDITKFLKREL